MLHIVSFNVPYPANYGGVVDVFHRIRTLHKLGVEIHLHAFQYGRPQQAELEKYCSRVYYYPRHTGLASALTRKPYIVKSRENNELVARLVKDDAPILVEGLHCCSLLEAIDGRRILVRAHNVEHDYYNRLADAESNLFRRLYLRTDAHRLKRYESILLRARTVLAVTEADAAHFRSIGCTNVILMPTSHDDDEVVSTPTPQNDDSYAMYHADLSVPENIEAVLYIAENIIARSNSRFVIAGRNPAPAITKCLASYPNTRLVANPDDTEMHRLISGAQVQILFTSFPTGLKLKLLNSLYAGRHILVNSPMVAGTQLGKLCAVSDDVQQQLEVLERLMRTPFTNQDIALRRSFLGSLYGNEAIARVLLNELEKIK